MADEVNATDKGGNFTPHDEGQFAALCADVINLGQRIEQFPGQPARIMDKCAVVFATDTEGETKDVSVEFSVSMNEKANLRKFLESWRGKSYTEDEVDAGVPLHRMEGVAALLGIEHKRSNKGRTYAKIVSISRLPKGMKPPVLQAVYGAAGYKRAEFWADRKKQYAEEAQRWAHQQATTQDGPPLDESQADDGAEDDLPF